MNAERIMQELRDVNTELQQQNKLIQTIFDSSIDVIAVVDKEMRYLTMNKKCAELYGFNREETLGKRMTDIFPQTKDTAIYHAIRDALNGTSTHNMSYKSVVVDRFMETFFVPLKDQHNEIYAVLLIAHDNTPVIEAAEKLISANTELATRMEELRRSEDRYHNMIREVKDYAILLMDVDGNILNWNQGAEEIKGYTAEEIIGKNFRIFYPPGDQLTKLPEKLITEAARAGRATHEGWRVRKDGNMFWGSIVITALHNDAGEVTGFSKVTRDLTERKLADDKLRVYAAQLERKNSELERSNSELSSFSYVASHDLQEPLRKIQAFGNLILEHETAKMSNAGKDYFDRMIRAAGRMQALIDSLLEFSRTTTAHKKFEQTDLNELVNDVKKELREQIKDTHTTITTHGLPVVPVISFQFRQLLSNLITNSIKYSKAGVEPDIEITGRLLPAGTHKLSGSINETDYLELSVRDNGIGFEQEHAEKVFELFQRLHGRNEYTGSGIGLAICKKIAENHNGYMTAEGYPDKGAVFHFYMPVSNDAIEA